MKLHLGCGTNYLENWINIDISSPIADIILNLNQPLPFKDNSVSFIFNEHFIEHLTQKEALSFLQECIRILTPSGILRISTPNLEWVLNMYDDGNLEEWRDVGWLPKSRCKLINEAMRSWGHQFVYDLDEIRWILHTAGFNNINQVPWRISSHSVLTCLEFRPYHKEIILEASI